MEPVRVVAAIVASDGDFAWLAVVLGAVAVALIIVGVAGLSRGRARRRARVSDWRHRAAFETAEVAATARLLAAGTPPSASIVQEVIASSRALEELAHSAPDDRMRTAADRAREAVHAMGLAINADASARRAQPPVSRDQLDVVAASLQASAANADAALRHAHHLFNL